MVSFSTNSPVKRVMVLGANGFIGRHLSAALQHQSQQGQNFELSSLSLPQFDLTQQANISSLAEVLGPGSLVFLLAARKRQFGDTLEAFEENMTIAANFCRADALNPGTRVVFFSSAAVYGEDVENLHITEQTAVCPRSYYGAAKFAAECILQKQFEKRLLCLRPATIYGEGDNSDYSPSGFARKALAGEPITLWGDGTEQREFIYVKDIAEIAITLGFSEHCTTLNTVSGISYSYAQIINELRALGLKPAVETRPRSKQKVDNKFDNSYLCTLLPAMRFTTLAEGLSHLVTKHE